MFRRLVPAILVSCAALWPSLTLAAEPAVDYRRDVEPILRAHCYRCHGPKERESGLRLDLPRSVIAGGNAGPAIVPGKSGESLLIKAVSGAKGVTRMPPEDEAPALAEEQIVTLRRWVDAGAVLPADEPFGETDQSKKDKKQHWSLQPIVQHPLPSVERAGWSKGGIDRFVLTKLEARRIAPSAEADRVTLVRRLYLDLLGLPPTIAEVDDFCSDPSPDAYERCVDRLLSSPHYGERFGRLWLDQARYADSDGYSNDAPRVMWPYRDYVIDALNRDVPFDQFTIEQIAGDLLPGATQSQLIATGFHRNTQIYSEGDSATEEYRVENVVDRVHTTGVVFLGLTLGCARCHDHKFDAIAQQEFFQLYAFFNNQDEPTETVTVGTPPQRSTTLVLRERQQPRETRIHLRGEFTRLGRAVSADVPAALPPLPTAERARNRLDLARWLVSPDNPLTPRVTVNRQWQSFFGRGLVATDDDFGTQGEPPTHPELLDCLAQQFIARGWSMKSLHRTIVTSATYRQSSVHRKDLVEIDPSNRLLARQNRIRLDAELVRDVSLSAAGLLSKKLKGPSVFPPQPDGVMRLSQHADRTWEPSRGEDRYRRGMYTFFWRLTPHPFLTLFDAPEANAACTRRARSNTPLQALTLLNDEVFVEAARSLAARVIRDCSAADDAQRIRYAFRLCVAREPAPAEVAAVAKLLSRESRPAGPPSSADNATAAWLRVARTLLNLDETVTRE
ncbi:MAG: PSD1 and planctomycete cytochrome C domain-containing protein [Pirellulales bacterium]